MLKCRAKRAREEEHEHGRSAQVRTFAVDERQCRRRATDEHSRAGYTRGPESHERERIGHHREGGGANSEREPQRENRQRRATNVRLPRSVSTAPQQRQQDRRADGTAPKEQKQRQRASAESRARRSDSNSSARSDSDNSERSASKASSAEHRSARAAPTVGGPPQSKLGQKPRTPYGTQSLDVTSQAKKRYG